MIPLLIVFMAVPQPFDASLYTYSALNVLDCYSSLRAFEIGAVEINPVLAPFSDNRYKYIAAKAVMSALSYYVLKRIYKKNKTMGWIFSISANVLMAVIVYHNMRVK